MRFLTLTLTLVSSLVMVTTTAHGALIGYDMEAVVPPATNGFANVLHVDTSDDRGRINGASQSTGGDPVKFGSFSALFDAGSDNLSPSGVGISLGSQFTVMAHVYLQTNTSGDRPIIGGGGSLFEVIGGELNFQTSAGLQATSGAGILADQWHHVAMTFDAGTLKFFVDGSQVGGDFDVSGTIGTTASGSNLLVGNFSGFDLGGFMDDFYFSSTVLSASDIAFYNANTITTPIPEPASMLLLGVGSLLMMQRRK